MRKFLAFALVAVVTAGAIQDARTDLIVLQYPPDPDHPAGSPFRESTTTVDLGAGAAELRASTASAGTYGNTLGDSGVNGDVSVYVHASQNSLLPDLSGPTMHGLFEADLDGRGGSFGGDNYISRAGSFLTVDFTVDTTQKYVLNETLGGKDIVGSGFTGGYLSLYDNNSSFAISRELDAYVLDYGLKIYQYAFTLVAGHTYSMIQEAYAAWNDEQGPTGSGTGIAQFDLSPVPEPPGLGMLAMGLIALLGYGRRCGRGLLANGGRVALVALATPGGIGPGA